MILRDIVFYSVPAIDCFHSFGFHFSGEAGISLTITPNAGGVDLARRANDN
jgi:hypothetical protein